MARQADPGFNSLRPQNRPPSTTGHSCREGAIGPRALPTGLLGNRTCMHSRLLLLRRVYLTNTRRTVYMYESSSELPILPPVVEWPPRAQHSDGAQECFTPYTSNLPPKVSPTRSLDSHKLSHSQCENEPCTAYASRFLIT